MESGGASRTAVFVCQGRAAADGLLAAGRFSDPIATRLLHPEEARIVEAARQSDRAGVDQRDRFAVEAVRACAQVVVPRTVLIDDALGDAFRRLEDPQVVLLGAGLDTRPWRLDSLADADVYAVDHPASSADAESRAAGLTPIARHLIRVPVDLERESLTGALHAAGHVRSRPTIWLWEGVVPYLERSAVIATVAAMTHLSATGSVLIVNYQARSPSASLGRKAMSVMARILRTETATADEPWRSTWTPPQLAELLGRNGFHVEGDVDLLQTARSLGSPSTRRRSLRNGRVAVARFVGSDPLRRQ